MHPNPKEIREIQELRLENAKLRTQLSNVYQRAKAYSFENTKLREACAELLEMAESHDPEWLHWPEMYEELRKLGVEV